MGFTCSTCDKYHDEFPLAIGYDKPLYYDPEDIESEKTLTSDVYILRNGHFFIRGVLEIPIINSEEKFSYGVWVSLNEKNFNRYVDTWESDHRAEEPPYFGWLSNSIDGYPETLDLKTHVHQQERGSRPKIELEHTDHPLAREQHHGITMERVHEIVSPFLTH